MPERLILVIIPTLNEARTIEGVVAQLSTNPPPSARLRFVIADGGSTDGTPEIVSRIAALHNDIVLLHNPKRLQSAGVNLAAERYGADADLLLRCDAHAMYPDGFVRSLVEVFDRTQADSIVVPMDSVGHSCLQRAVAWVSDTPVGSGGSAHRGGRRSGYVDHGHHALFRMESFRAAGGYEDSFSHNEDAEFDCRFRSLGGRIWLDGETRLSYHPRATFGRLWKQYRGYGKGRSRTVRRHPHSLRLRQLAVPSFLALCCLCVLAAFVAPLFLAVPGVYVLALAATSVLLAARHRSLCGLLAGPAAFTMHAAWAFGFFEGLLTVREARWKKDAMPASTLSPSAKDAA